MTKNSLLLYSLLLVAVLLTSCNSATENTDTTLAPISIDSVTAAIPSAPKPKTMESFIPEGFEVLSNKKADLNGDQLEDVILILKASNEEESSDYTANAPTLRPLLILLGDEAGSLTYAGRNDKVVYCVDCGGQMGDPFSDLSVEGRFFTITHYGGSSKRWSRIVTFAYNTEQSSWFLHLDGTEAFDANTPQQVTKEIQPETITPFEEFDVYK
jgi:hypothetical protein